MFEACLWAHHEGLAGIDFIPEPYAQEADWSEAYVWAERAAEAGLGVSAHAGEFSSANIAAALRVPGITRLGHAVHATDAPDLLQAVMDAGVTVGVLSHLQHGPGGRAGPRCAPDPRARGCWVPVTLNSDNPMRMGTSIGREYELARGLGFSEGDLVSFTRNAVAASFTTEARRTKLLEDL